jgi:tryptophan synthase alpha chain
LTALETNAVASLFHRLREQGRKAFIAFLTAGDPDLDATVQVARRLAAEGVSLIEIGFPYSDPIADGPVIQASYTRALDRGLHVDDIFSCIKQIAQSEEIRSRQVPVVAMVSCSLIYRRGEGNFVDQAAAAGVSGLIVPDLPVEESGLLADQAGARGLKLIQLITPTTPRERALLIAQRSTGFLYCVSVAGITGERDRLPDALLEQLAWLRTQTELPLCVGFGVSKPEHVRSLRDVADGVIVGSAIVRRLESAASRPLGEVLDEVGQYVKTLIDALDTPAP